MSEKSDPGAAFRVVASSGRVVFRGHAGRSTGGWSARYSHVYPLDFDHVRTTGTYTVVVSGAKSPRFRIEPPRKLYAGALANSLFFYEAERDGPDFIRSALRTAPGHLNDEHAMTYLTPKPNADDGFNGDLKPLGVRIDASGGWWDAGDYPKFVETTSYTVALMLLRVRDYPAELGAGAGRSNFASEAAFGTDFLLRMWNDRTRTLYYQVGIGEGNSKIVGDHDIWRLPQADDTYGGKNPASATSATGPCSARGRPDRGSARTSPAVTPRRSRSATRTSAGAGPGEALPPRGGAHLRSRRHLAEGAAPHRLHARLLSRELLAGRPRARRRRALRRAHRRTPAGRAPARAAAPLPPPRDALGEPVHPQPLRRDRHAQPLRRLGDRALGALSRARPGRTRVRAADDPRRPPRRSRAPARRCDPAGAPGSVRVRLHLGAMGHDFPRRRPRPHGERVDQLTGTHRYAAWSSRWLGNIFGANAPGSLARRR
jgi:Glycosyl hydrolase family 9/Cellulase N-terminal ig-like domain